MFIFFNILDCRITLRDSCGSGEKYNKINDAENSQAAGNVNGLQITPKSIPCE